MSVKNLIFESIVGVGISAVSFATDSLNVLFILVGALGSFDVACLGNTLHGTPNVDRSGTLWLTAE